MERPAWGSVLRAVQLPPLGGDTCWASMYAAYDALSAPMKHMLDGLTAVHDGGHVFRRRFDKERHYPTTEQPVVIRHPESGRKALFVNAQYTTHIVQMTARESDALLGFLYRHVETPEFHCRFKWRAGSMVFWDNRAVQHKAVFDYFPRRRVGTRVQVCGEKPVAAQ
jgi:taurine dioxygenase